MRDFEFELKYKELLRWESENDFQIWGIAQANGGTDKMENAKITIHKVMQRCCSKFMRTRLKLITQDKNVTIS